MDTKKFTLGELYKIAKGKDTSCCDKGNKKNNCCDTQETENDCCDTQKIENDCCNASSRDLD